MSTQSLRYQISAAIVQAWHPRLDNDAAHQWLRRSIKTMCESAGEAPR